MTVASMSMIEPTIDGLRKRPADRPGETPQRERDASGETTIVPKDSIAGNALTAVVAIMMFLAAVTSGGVMMVIGAASNGSRTSPAK